MGDPVPSKWIGGWGTLVADTVSSRGKQREAEEHGKAFLGAGTDTANVPPHSSLVPTASSSFLLLSPLTHHGSQWLSTSRIYPPLWAGHSGQVHVCRDPWDSPSPADEHLGFLNPAQTCPQSGHLRIQSLGDVSYPGNSAKSKPAEETEILRGKQERYKGVMLREVSLQVQRKDQVHSGPF